MITDYAAVAEAIRTGTAAARRGQRRAAMRSRVTVANHTAYRTLMAVDHVHVQVELLWPDAARRTARILLTDRLAEETLADGSLLIVDLLTRDADVIREAAIDVLIDHLLKIGA